MDTDQGNKVIEDAGECTSIQLDSIGTVHIAYLSLSDRAPKHAFCLAGQDCTNPKNWTKERIDDPEAVPSKGVGRDVNMYIDRRTRSISVIGITALITWGG